jgi:hypothetical protein
MRMSLPNVFMPRSWTGKPIQGIHFPIPSVAGESRRLFTVSPGFIRTALRRCACFWMRKLNSRSGGDRLGVEFP